MRLLLKILYFTGLAILSMGFIVSSKPMDKNKYEIFPQNGGACRVNFSVSLEDYYIPKIQKEKLIGILKKAKSWMQINRKERMAFEKTVGIFKYTLYINVQNNGSYGKIADSEESVIFIGTPSGSCVSFFTGGFFLKSAFKTPNEKQYLVSHPCVRFRSGIHLEDEKAVDDLIARLQGKAVSEIDKKFQ